MARQMPAVTAGLQGHVDRAAAVLDRPGRQDLVPTMLVPLVHGVLSDLSGLPVTDLPPETAVSSLFSKAAGVSRRRRMNAELATLLDNARRRYPADPEEDHLARLALAILGRDAMMGTFGLSLGALFEQAAGRPLNQIAPETLPPLTGVPYIDRIARADGTVVRLRLDRFGQTGAPRDRMRYFGAGAHTCLGRPVSLDLWRRLVLALGTSARRVRVVELALRRDDVFALPERLIAEVS